MQELTFEAEATATKTRGEEVDEFLSKMNADKFVIFAWDKDNNLRVSTDNIPASDLPELMTWTYEKFSRHNRERIQRIETARLQKGRVKYDDYNSRQMVEPSRN